MGTNFCFSFHYGDFDPSRKGDPFNHDGQFAGFPADMVLNPVLVCEGQPIRYTFWLAPEHYARKAQLVTVSREELEQINIRDFLISHS